MVSTVVKIASYAITDPYVRDHGRAIDQVLNDDWWASQPHKSIGITKTTFTHEETLDLAIGVHTVEYAASGYMPDYAWHAKIHINGILMGEGDVGRHTHLKIAFKLGEGGEVSPPNKLKLRHWTLIIGVPTTILLIYLVVRKKKLLT